MLKLRPTFISLILCAHLLLLPTQAMAKKAQSWTSEFMSRIDQSVGQEWESAGEKLSASIFESITDQEFFKTKVVGNLQASLKVQRKVFDNHDILDTWTVIDIMKVPLYLPIPLLSNDMGITGGAFGSSLALNFSGVAYNIRQVRPVNMDKLIKTGEIQKNLEEARLLGDEITNLSEDGVNNNQEGEEIDGGKKEDGDLTIVSGTTADPEDDSLVEAISDFAFWSKSNPKMRARYSKIWRILTHPLSIPLTEKSFKRYPVGDIASYGVEGTVQLGLSVGWSQVDISGLGGMTNAQAGLGISSYVKGDFRISILKEKEDQAIVKLTRVRNRGEALTIGHASMDQEIFSGFVVLGQNVLKIKEQIIPFSLVFNRNLARQFDISYRYDFNKPAAVKAYEKAVLGRFKESATLSLQKDSGVTRATKREQNRDSYTLSNKVKISLFFESASSTTRAVTRAVITIGNKRHHLFSSENIQYKGYDTLWGTSESKHHSFTSAVILDDPDHFQPEKVSLQIEGRIEDSDTSAKELARYYSEVETALQKDGLFPRPPARDVKIDCDQLEKVMGEDYVKAQCEEEDAGKESITNYGRTSFFYQINLNYKQLQIIRNTKPIDMWKAMERAYNVKPGSWSSSLRRGLTLLTRAPITLVNIPLYLANLNIRAGGKLISAINFYQAWKDLKKVEESKEVVIAFGKLFRTVHFGAELVKLVRILTADESVPYYFTAKADRLWGQMSSSGKTFANPIALIAQADQIINFDKTGPRASGDPSARVTKIKLEKLSRTEINLSFDLSDTPEYIYLRIDRTPNWSRYKNILKTILYNNGKFKKGHNEIVVDIEESEGFMKTFAKKLFNGKHSTLMMSFSRQKQTFGPVNAEKFKFEYVPLDPTDPANSDGEVISNHLVYGPQ